MKDQLNSFIPDTYPQLQGFFLTIHDWVVNLVGDEDYQWPHYGGSLVTALNERLENHPFLMGWFHGILYTPLDIRSLLCRHYLVEDCLQQEIVSTLSLSRVYQLIAASITDDGNFATIDYPMFNKTEPGIVLINGLRERRAVIHDAYRNLSIFDTEYEGHVLLGHALLSSVALLYGLQLVEVVLEYERNTHTHDFDPIWLTSVSSTLTNVKGILCHG